MTNEQAKQEAIKKAYGDLYEKLKDYLDNDGFVVVKYGNILNHPHNFGIRECLTIMVKDKEVFYLWRLVDFPDIQNNNGWIRIEPDGSNLPESGDFRVYNNNSNIIFASTNDRFDSDDVAEIFEDGSITHYKPITPEKLPLY